MKALFAFDIADSDTESRNNTACFAAVDFQSPNILTELNN